MTASSSDKARIAGIALCLLLAGCSQGQQTPIKMTITEVYEDKSTMGCMGTNWVTVVRSDDGRADRMCHRWGQPGEVIAGCWVEGHWDWAMNGFRRVCK